MSDALVIDANTVIEILLRSERGVAADRACEEHHLVAPECLDPEVLQTLRGLERGGKITGTYADACVQELREAAITRVPHLPLLDDAWSLRHNLSAYDAMYVALARDLDCPLLTLDAGILGAPDVGVTVIRPGA